MYIMLIKKRQAVSTVDLQENRAQEAENHFSTEKFRKDEGAPPEFQPQIPDFKFHYFSDFLTINNLEFAC
jgi:hypothetical protein